MILILVLSPLPLTVRILMVSCWGCMYGSGVVGSVGGQLGLRLVELGVFLEVPGRSGWGFASWLGGGRGEGPGGAGVGLVGV
jgi:hypothetical protein